MNSVKTNTDSTCKPKGSRGAGAASKNSTSCEAGSKSHETTVSSASNNFVYFPAITWDYYLRSDPKCGLGVVANRNIKKGDLVFSDSLEFCFTDVQEGDRLLLVGHGMASEASRSNISATIPVTRDMLLRTHGVPHCRPDPTGASGGIVEWQLEVPGMLMNHSCNPNVIDDSQDATRGEGYAARNIRRGEELTYCYFYQYYDRGPFFDPCLCGSKQCRGKQTGFKELSKADKDTFLPKAAEATKAMHRADLGDGLPVKEEVVAFPPRVQCVQSTIARGAIPIPRVVFPGPSYALAPVEIRQDEESGKYALYALKDFAFGERVYEFWRQDWPFGGTTPINMVAAAKLASNDLVESTVIELDPRECAAAKDRSGHYQFSGFDLLTEHSCEPNLTYNDFDEDEDDEWQGAYATRDIHQGEKLTVDINSILWDRSRSSSAGECNCGASKCTGTTKGFKFLSHEEQMERKYMTWRRVEPPYEGEDAETTKYVGMALTPHVRVSWRSDCDLGKDFEESTMSSSSSSSEVEFDSDDDESSDEG